VYSQLLAWEKAMSEELAALECTSTCEVVPYMHMLSPLHANRCIKLRPKLMDQSSYTSSLSCSWFSAFLCSV
jgi:hypothetical protein